MKRIVLISLLLVYSISCSEKPQETVQEETPAVVETPFVWENANMYFLLTDRFNNGDASNDVNYDRSSPSAVLRGFEGGDIVGITKKIEEGYFTNLGINSIWFTPIVDQVRGIVDEGTGATYAFHGYWAVDWTALDPNFGTKEDLKNLVKVAHANGIRIVLDGVINHTGPVTDQDSAWPSDWVRTSPKCEYTNYENTTSCTLVDNLPDVLTSSNENVELPPQLVEKWKSEGRYEQEVKELDEFFERTGYPRAPKYHIIKWLTDYIVEFGIDGYRCDTVKHLEEDVWKDFQKECRYAFAQWKAANPDAVLDDNEFYIVGEVYNYGISTGQLFDFGDKKVNYYENGFTSLINFELKTDANNSYEEIFTKYDTLLQGPLSDYSVLNYLTSHDDGSPFDKERTRTIESGTKLLLCPGGSQVYYGDEYGRSLVIEGTVGDATLRSNMDWDLIASDSTAQAVLAHWSKLGRFRVDHPSVGAGKHEMISEAPYVFKRTFTKGAYSDSVVVGLDLPAGSKEIDVAGVFADGSTVVDKYSGVESQVSGGKVVVDSAFDVVLLEAGS